MTVSVREDICIVSCIFSHDKNAMRMNNLKRFLAGVESQGGKVFLLELAYDDIPFLLSSNVANIQIRTSNHMWHKERLLNILIRSLPPQFTKVVWADADLLFRDSTWISTTSEVLEDYVVLQPYETVIRLGPNQQVALDRDERMYSFGSRYATAEFDISAGLEEHGHTGFAWAARRDFLETALLFELCISGSGDHVMAHGFLGDTHSTCVQRHFLGAPAYQKSFENWAQLAYAQTGGRIGFVPTEIWHQYHGPHDGNAYMRRSYDLLQSGFNPSSDLRVDSEGLFEITQANPSLQAWQLRHFK